MIQYHFAQPSAHVARAEPAPVRTVIVDPVRAAARNVYALKSADWQPPLDYAPTTGVLVTRTGPAEYAVYLGGRWTRVTLAEFQSRFKTVLPPGLPVGWWGLIPELRDSVSRAGYKDNLTPDALAVGLAVAREQLLGLGGYARRPVRVSRGLNAGDRPTVSV